MSHHDIDSDNSQGTEHFHQVAKVIVINLFTVYAILSFQEYYINEIILYVKHLGFITQHNSLEIHRGCFMCCVSKVCSLFLNY